MNSSSRVHLAYEWRGAGERMVRIGMDGPALLFLAPLFEEANRTRHFMIEVMHGLATLGFSCFLPDLPGTMESLTPIEDIEWADWTGAIPAAAAAAEMPVMTVAIRAGCLLDSAVDPAARWRLAPQDGANLFRELVRVRMAANRENGLVSTVAQIEAEAAAGLFDVAGYQLSPALTAGLKGAAVSGAARIMRLEGDIQPADHRIAAPPLWRRSEPDHDPALAALLIDDIAQWAKTCAAG